MKKYSFYPLLLFGLIFTFFIVTNSYGYQTYHIIYFGPILLVYYFLFIYNRQDGINPYIVLIPILLFLSDISIGKVLVIPDNYVLAYQIILQFIIQLLYFFIFRREGARVVQEDEKDNFKIFLPVILVFIVFGFYFLDESNTFFYVMFVLVAIQCLIIITLALFRPVNNYSYYLGVIGVVLLFFSNFFYLFYFFKSSNTTMFTLSTGFYVISQILLFESIGKAIQINEVKD